MPCQTRLVRVSRHPRPRQEKRVEPAQASDPSWRLGARAGGRASPPRLRMRPPVLFFRRRGPGARAPLRRLGLSAPARALCPLARAGASESRATSKLQAAAVNGREADPAERGGPNNQHNPMPRRQRPRASPKPSIGLGSSRANLKTASAAATRTEAVRVGGGLRARGLGSAAAANAGDAG